MTSTVVIVQLDESTPPGRLTEWLREAGARLDLRDAAVAGELPANLDAVAGLVVLGGGMGAADDHRAPYLPAVRALLREAVSREVPTLGICLGAQLLALAHGGRVEPNPGGPEFGAQLVAKRAAASDDPLFGPLAITPDVIQWHFDAVTVLPPGAIQLAASPACENQAFRLGRLAWGVQFHIETTPATVREWAAEDADALVDYDVAQILERSDARHADIAETWRPFAASFAAVVRDPQSVAPARGVPTVTAAPVTDPDAIRAALAAELSASRQGGVLPMPQVRPPDG